MNPGPQEPVSNLWSNNQRKPTWDPQKAHPFGNINEKSLDGSYLQRTQIPQHLCSAKKTLLILHTVAHPLPNSLPESSFIHSLATLFSSFSPFIHSALISAALTSTNTAWVWNQVPEIMVSKDTWYL